MNEFFKRLYTKSFDDFIQLLEEALKKEQKKLIVTANPETFMIASKEKEMEKIILDKDTTLVPDGIGIVKAAHMLDYAVTERITGIDIAWELLRLGNEQKKSIYLLGAKEEVISLVVKKIEQDYPNLKMLGYRNGYVEDKDQVFEDIKKKEPDIVLVALGIPAQEKLIYKHFKDFKKGIFVGVGGSFDVISGTKKRAPKIFQKLNLEWFYRLIKEPKRIKRFYNSNVKFIFQVRKYKKREK